MAMSTAQAVRQHAVTYNEEFWKKRDQLADRSAAACVPLLIEAFAPTSVVDVGCGQGHWLAAFARRGIVDVLGIDGPGVLQNSSLLVSRDQFLERNLAEPIQLDRRFDLALCLEVAEHLPPARARTLVASLTELSSVVIFSAAIPGQGGVGHVNENWPWYWRERFAERSFVQYDPFRHRLWHNADVAPWYRQNLLVYAQANLEGPAQAFLAPYRSLDLTLIASDTLYRLTRPSLIGRAYGRLKRTLQGD
jgi:SAM-dependent methyltransferase